MNLNLYVVTHKEPEPKVGGGRFYVGVGANRQLNGVELYDDSGENISAKNPSYCELTVLYWIWKNVKSDGDLYVGLEHYRRFFCKPSLPHKPMKKEEFAEILQEYDVILPRKTLFGFDVYHYYKRDHYIEDLELCAEIIKRKFPAYEKDCNAVLKSRKISLCNMFVMSKKRVDEYCEWLFSILSEAEQTIDLEGRNTYQRRAFGFLAERLFNVWLHHQHLKTRYLPVRNADGRMLHSKIQKSWRR